ncbi:uncharacterized protein LOC6727521 [Drosophila simulans]|uniref:GD20148 n=1 Tax=Drosophila simulans TaxID=7240 RepID=B4QTY1_DROSI|nr:uncharacterized protein LOC6727521 [Drosophila simulans]EDX12404.1 GD20148 [Drosophila simulans]KMZ02740.1 uncharacterized protein Dsimw501_GD20148 [Drosophila simulans]
MSWLSTIIGIILLTLLCTVWIAAHPRWEQMAQAVATQMKYDDRYRIHTASKAAKKVDTQIHDFYVKLENQKKVAAREILDSAYTETTKCIEVFYSGELEQQFKDCIEHVTSLHMERLKSLLQITTKRQASGASRLNIWH